MSAFSDTCIAQLQALLSSTAGLPAVAFEKKHVRASGFSQTVVNRLRQAFGFAERPVKLKELPETYLVAKFRFKDHDIELYVYENQADVLRDDVAYVCERADYASDAELMKDFLSHVSGALSEDTFNGNRRGVSRAELIVIVCLMVVGLIAVSLLLLRITH